MTREQYLRKVIDSYLDSRDTPSKARRLDWAIATTFYHKDIPHATIAHAIRLATLRRHRRDAQLKQLEPIRSLAYFRPLIEHLLNEPPDPGYVEYVRWSYENRLDWPFDEGEEAENSGWPPTYSAF